MNADRRVVPSQHVSSVLAEEHISERTLGMKYMLEQSDKKLDKVANKWTAHDGINSLSRVMLQNVGRVPVKLSPIKKVTQHTPPNTGHAHEEKTSHPVHDHQHNQWHSLQSHGDHSRDHHEEHTHGNHGHEAHGHHKEESHSHGHATHSDHKHTPHGHGGKTGFASFASTGHWFGDHGAFIFGMFGRGLGELIGYIFKLLAILMLFGPTRTALLTIIVIVLLNIYAGTSLSVWLGAGALLVVHGIFSMIAHFSGSGGHEGHGGGGHGHDDHGHGGGGHGHH